MFCELTQRSHTRSFPFFAQVRSPSATDTVVKGGLRMSEISHLQIFAGVAAAIFVALVSAICVILGTFLLCVTVLLLAWLSPNITRCLVGARHKQSELCVTWERGDNE